jgi:NADP-dependent 3-hydroxy acid dehydrogenase YdfG/acyl carrier protein/NADPH:quinone reductase-like Zn-dependent oxidoreductase
VTAKLVGLPRFASQSRDLAALRTSLPQERSVEDFYAGLDQIGLSYGPAFQTVTQLRTNADGDQVLARVEMRSELTHNLEQYHLHPTLLDACFQSLMVMLGDAETSFLPTGFSELCLYRKQVPSQIWCHAERIYQDERQIRCNLTILDDDGQVVAQLRAMHLSAASKRDRVDRFGDKVKRQILAYDWTYGETLSEPKRLGHWLVVGDTSTTAQTVMDQLELYGATILGIAAYGDCYQHEGQRFILRPGSMKDAALMLRDLGELDGIVLMHGLSATAESDDPTAEKSLSSTIALVQALLAQGGERRPRIYVVTQSAFAVENYPDRVEPAQSAINGFARVAFNELEGFRFSTIDLPQRASQQQLENLALELLCDAPHDEVALRGSLRLCSELRDSTLLSADRVIPMPLTDDHPILVRALRSDSDSVGTARVIAGQTAPVGDRDVHLRIEATRIPADLLKSPSADTIAQFTIEIVARVIGLGPEVTDLMVGDRVCGFGPADLASHCVHPRKRFQLAKIDESADAVGLTSTLGMAARAEFAMDLLRLKPGTTALVLATAFGCSVAEALKRRNVHAVLLNDAAMRGRALDESAYSCCPEGIAQALADATHGEGFDLLVVPAQLWQKTFDFSMLRTGGQLLDLDAEAGPIALPKLATGVVRTDFRVMLAESKEFEQASARAVALISEGKIEAEPALAVSIADLAWQKLPLADAQANLVLTFETHGNDLPVVQLDEVIFDPQGTYLITGGFGGFGQKTAEWLVENGARHLVLTGRTGADNDSRRAFVEKLEQRGVRVLAAACNTADYQRLQELLKEVNTQWPPLRGVFHSGAEIIDQPLSEIDFETFARVMQSKALGGWNLHQLTQELPLDHFVLYSSVANLVGNSRQAAYSAANGFLNGLAHLRQSLGLPGTSVNWGAISDVGVVAQDEKLEQFLRYTGLRGIESSEGLSLLRSGLARGLAQFGVTMITSWADWARFETRGATSPRFASLIAADSQGQDNSMRDQLLVELSQLDPTEQVELLASLMVEIIASVLKADPSAIPFDKAINQLGVDSLMATEIQMLLDTQLGLSISILELIGDTTVRSLATQSLKNLNPSAASGLASVATDAR